MSAHVAVCAPLEFVLRRADGVCGAGGPRTVRDRFEDAVVCVVSGSASGAVRDGESVCLVVLGSGEGDVAVSARRACRLRRV